MAQTTLTNPPTFTPNNCLSYWQGYVAAINAMFTEVYGLLLPRPLANYANDAAAAAGGIAVGQYYRTGSAVMVRVA